MQNIYLNFKLINNINRSLTSFLDFPMRMYAAVSKVS